MNIPPFRSGMGDIRQQVIQKITHLPAVFLIDLPHLFEMAFIVMGGKVPVDHCL